MGVFLAVLLGAVGVALIIAGVNGSALPLFESIIGPGSSVATKKGATK